MSHAPTPSNEARPRPERVDTVARFVLIAALLGVVVAAFAYLGGWLTLGALTPGRIADTFESVDGVHAGFRRNHAKGVCVTGYFESNGNGARLSKAAVFRAGRVPVAGRFSLSGGRPYGADAAGTVRGLALQLKPTDGDEWRTAMINLPVFPVSTPEAFYERLAASEPDPITGKPDPAHMAAFLAGHPETVAAIGIIKSEPPSPGFADSTFRSLNAFRFTSAAGATTPVRWMLVPGQASEASEASDAPPPDDDNYLFDALIAQLHHQPLRWRLVVIVGQPGDPTDDATLPWSEDRRQVDVGTLVLDRVVSEDDSAINNLNFDPLVLPPGIAPSDDPLLSARSAVYARSYTRRAGETKPPSAITSADTEDGK